MQGHAVVRRLVPGTYVELGVSAMGICIGCEGPVVWGVRIWHHGFWCEPQNQGALQGCCIITSNEVVSGRQSVAEPGSWSRFELIEV